MNDYWSRESGGAISIVLGGIEARSLTTTCSAAALFARSPAAAFGGQFVSRVAHTHLLTMSRESCGVGMGSLGGIGGTMASGVGTSAQYGLGVAVHEFGHNLGFDHANAAVCSTGDASDETFSTACATTTYADFLDVMAGASAYSVPHLSSPQRIRAGFMTDALTASATSGTAAATILPLGRSSGPRALIITDPAGGETYYVEYRTPDDADSTSPEFTASDACSYATAGVRCFSTADASTGGLRVLRVVGSATVALAVGTTPSGQRDMHLDAGETFRSYDGSFALRVDALDAAVGASVTVAFGDTPLPALARTVSTVTDTTPLPFLVETSYPAPISLPAAAPVVERFTSTTRVSTKKRIATVRIDGETMPTGRITVFINGKKLKSVAVKKWTTHIPLPKSAAKKWITVSYSGNDVLTASKSPRVRIRTS
jgi:hypothetical protein